MYLGKDSMQRWRQALKIKTFSCFTRFTEMSLFFMKRIYNNTRKKHFSLGKNLLRFERNKIRRRVQGMLFSKFILYVYAYETILAYIYEHHMSYKIIIWIIYKISCKAYIASFWIFSVAVKLGSRISIPPLKVSVFTVSMYHYWYTHKYTNAHKTYILTHVYIHTHMHTNT